jgi:hypothetical protein
MKDRLLTRLRGLVAPGPITSAARRVFVVGAYLPNGGTYMTYHLGRILHLDFGLEVVAVSLGGERPENGVFDYDMDFPTIGIVDMEQQIGDEDILLASPSFSNYYFGARLPGRKLMYVQGFNTFALLDRYFDHYVCVSSFVARFVRTTYAFTAPVIPAFIELGRFPTTRPWRERPARSIVIHLKGDPAFRKIALVRLRNAVARRFPGVDLDHVLEQPALPQTDFVAQLGGGQHLVSLSPAEGFGLVPLEAMAMGTTVIGFDGFGGREYMRPGKNCLVTSYPDIDGVAERLVAALGAPAFAERLAGAGRLTALQFGYRRFRVAWHDQFRRFLAAERVACPT